MISKTVKAQIAEAMSLSGITYSGQQSEPEFLSRIFSLRILPSHDRRYTNAYEDIHKHRVNNNDWGGIDWIYKDPRINLNGCEDKIFMSFLSATLLPSVRSNSDEASRLAKIYNKFLADSGYEFIQTDSCSEGLLFSLQYDAGKAKPGEVPKQIQNYINNSHLHQKLLEMNYPAPSDSAKSIQQASGLICDLCFSFLQQSKIEIPENADISLLLATVSDGISIMEVEQETREAWQSILSGLGVFLKGMEQLRIVLSNTELNKSMLQEMEMKYAQMMRTLATETALIGAAIGTWLPYDPIKKDSQNSV